MVLQVGGAKTEANFRRALRIWFHGRPVGTSSVEIFLYISYFFAIISIHFQINSYFFENIILFTEFFVNLFDLLFTIHFLQKRMHCLEETIFRQKKLHAFILKEITCRMLQNALKSILKITSRERRKLSHLSKKIALLSFNFANFSITELLKLEYSLTSIFTIDNMARAAKFFYPLECRRTSFTFTC